MPAMDISTLSLIVVAGTIVSAHTGRRKLSTDLKRTAAIKV